MQSSSPPSPQETYMLPHNCGATPSAVMSRWPESSSEQPGAVHGAPRVPPLPRRTPHQRQAAPGHHHRGGTGHSHPHPPPCLPPLPLPLPPPPPPPENPPDPPP